MSYGAATQRRVDQAGLADNASPKMNLRKKFLRAKAVATGFESFESMGEIMLRSVVAWRIVNR